MHYVLAHIRAAAFTAICVAMASTVVVATTLGSLIAWGSMSREWRCEARIGE